MKARNCTLSLWPWPVCTRHLPRNFYLLFIVLLGNLLTAKEAAAQCTAGYSEAKLNWQSLDYFTFNGNYSANGYLPNIAYAQNQYFALGTNRVSIRHGYAAAGIIGENNTHTAETGSYGTGEDIQFMGNGTITLAFDNEVNNLKFSMYDIDRSQSVWITAYNTALVPQNVTVARLGGGSSILTVTGSGTPSAVVTSSVSVIANSSVNASINVDIAGPVDSVRIVVTATGTGGGEDGSFWISDVTACTPGSFPNNYHQVSRPFTNTATGINQPGYVLQAFDKAVYALNPANGFAKLMFNDAAGPGNINSMAYDPYNRILYYVYSLTSNAGTNRAIRKYDFNTESFGNVVTDISAAPLFIPLVTSTSGFSVRGTGVESGAAAFYNGSLFLGIETPMRSSATNIMGNSGRENVIYRIDFDGSGNPYRACQVTAMPLDNGSGLIKDWADFVIHNGILYDFDGADDDMNVYHYDMTTGAMTSSVPTWDPGQPALDWNGNIYQIHADNSPLILPYVALYNPATFGIGTSSNITSNPMYTPAVPSLGDAAEAFRPKCDFGDAPATYDPVALSPAVHERDANLRLGNTFDLEWNLTSSAVATAEGPDDDGIGAAPALNFDGTINYSINVVVFNNTGVNATLGGWLDYNFNGVFDAGEGITVNVPSNASNQNINLTWNSLSVASMTPPYTFLRLRLTRASNGMTAATGMTGWFADGEVEDFQVVRGVSLPKDMQQFTLSKQNNASVDVKWSVNVQQTINNFEVLRSTDNVNWKKIATINANSGFGLQNYTYNDPEAPAGTSYYRITVNYQADAANKVTEVKSISIDNKITAVKVLPNPAADHASIQLSAREKGDAVVQVYDKYGKTIMTLRRNVTAGLNTIPLENLAAFAAGTYSVRVVVNGKVMNTQLIINKQ
jgi:hypothetical protein